MRALWSCLTGLQSLTARFCIWVSQFWKRTLEGEMFCPQSFVFFFDDQVHDASELLTSSITLANRPSLLQGVRSPSSLVQGTVVRQASGIGTRSWLRDLRPCSGGCAHSSPVQSPGPRCAPSSPEQPRVPRCAPSSTVHPPSPGSPELPGCLGRPSPWHALSPRPAVS